MIFCSSVRPELREMITVTCEQQCVLPWGNEELFYMCIKTGDREIQVFHRQCRMIQRYPRKVTGGSVPKEET